jgi:glycosylphosphatidylinositol transamidase
MLWTDIASMLLLSSQFLHLDLMASMPLAGEQDTIAHHVLSDRTGSVIESTLRTANNLLERLHASFFFYILATPGIFLKIGSYLPSVILISVAMLFGGLGEYVQAGWITDIASGLPDEKPIEVTAASTTTRATGEANWVRIRRPVLPAIIIMLLTHVYGTVLFYVATSRWLLGHSMVRNNCRAS